MVFEALVNPLSAEKRPWEMFFIGMIYSSLAIVLSLYIFKEYASLVMIFLTVLASIPILYAAARIEEKKDLVIESKFLLLKEHSKALSFFMFLFVGFVVSFSLWYVFLPDDTTTILFKAQVKEIASVHRSMATGNAIDTLGAFGAIFFNNIMVMAVALLFAFFYGVGAIFILTWNASIIGAAIGNFVVASQSHIATAFPMGLLRYSLHGIPEMLAYFMAGLAGSIISIAISRHDFGSGKFKKVVVDSLDLMFMAVLVLFVAALLEVFVTPVFF